MFVSKLSGIKKKLEIKKILNIRLKRSLYTIHTKTLKFFILFWIVDIILLHSTSAIQKYI